MKKKFLFLSIVAVLSVSEAKVYRPQIGYLYPAGGQRGQTFTITIGGQFLQRPNQVFISGRGVTGKVVKYIRPTYNLNREQRDDLIDQMGKVRDQNMTTMSQKERKAVLSKLRVLKKRKSRQSQKAKQVDKDKKTNTTGSAKKIIKEKNAVAKKKADNKKKNEEKKFGGRRRADHPLLMDLQHKNLRELLHITNIIFADRRKRQQNRQLGEMVVVEINIDKDALVGNRELRLLTKSGLTNPVVFQVGSFPEISELEPNSYSQSSRLPAPLTIKPLALPVVINGQIMPGDVDEFSFTANRGSTLVFEVSARALIPYLADAVPGWFQAVLTLYDSNGNEVAFGDDFRFSPDPVLFYKIPKTGIYRLRIRDAIYRGREDFVYRIAIAERPYIIRLFPLGGRTGVKTTATATGWNLPEQKLFLNTEFSDKEFREIAYYHKDIVSNFVPYAVGLLPEVFEKESNDSRSSAHEIKLPITVNGTIGRPNESDYFKFTGNAGDDVVAEIYARQLNSPLDSLLQLLDSSGKIIAWNDDFVHKEKYLHKARVGVLTHHADSYLTAKLPANGTYYVRLTDVQNHGGREYNYRLRVSSPQPDFQLFTTPSSISMRSGVPYPIKVHLLRRDGFNGKVKVELAPENKNFQIQGGVIPAGENSIWVTLIALNKGAKEPFSLKLNGTAEVDGVTFRRQAVPADNVMQAFLYRHLLPAKQLAVYVRPQKWNANPIKLLSKSPVEIPLGGKNEVKIKFRWGKLLDSLELKLAHSPEGITLGKFRVMSNRQGIVIELIADAEKVKAGFYDNLIIEVFRKRINKKNNKVHRWQLGCLPAIPVKITAAKQQQKIMFKKAK